MRYIRLPQFHTDWHRLPLHERNLVKQWMRDVLFPALEEYAANPAGYVWPKTLRFEKISGTDGVYAVTWSFSGPDGRATFHFDTVDSEPCLVWHRIGHHDIYKMP